HSRKRERGEDKQPAPAPAQPRNRLSADPAPGGGRSLSAAAPAPGLHVEPLDATVSIPGPGERKKPAPPRPKLGDKIAAILARLKPPALSPRHWIIIVAVPVLVLAAFVTYKALKARRRPPALIQTELQANVPGVKFFVDGQAVEPPVILAPGQEHVLQATRDGYQSSVQKVTPVAGQPVAPVQFMLSPLLPRLQVFSEVPRSAVSVGDQPVTALENGVLEVPQVAAGAQAVKVFSGTKQLIELPLSVEPGKAATLAGQIEAKNYSVAAASILGTHARVFASSDLQGNVSGQPPQAIPPDGMDVDTAASATFALSNGRTLTLEPTIQPVFIVSVTARN